MVLRLSSLSHAVPRAARAGLALVHAARAAFPCTVLTGALLTSACAPAADPLELRSLSPGWGWTGETTEITIIGARLFPQVVVGDQRGESQFDTAFQAFLQTDPPIALDPVQFVDTSTLKADVPPGITPGVYDVRVVDPSGVEALLESGFRVTETRADHLAFDVDTVGYLVTELASVGIHLADPEGGDVAEPMLVEVRTSSDEGATGLEFGDGLLDNQETIENGTGVRGNLHADGSATLLLRSSTAQDLTLTLSSADDPQITSATTLLAFSPGVPDHVVLSLPSADFTTVAGDEVDVGIDVVDALGNVIDATGLSVVLFEDADCGDLREVVDLLQAGPYPITLTTACEGNHLRAVGVGDEADSASFDVLPGAMEHYNVHAVPNSVVAGRGVLAVQVDAVDSFDNLISDHVAGIELTDSAGGLDADAGAGSQVCDAFVDGQTVCTATPVRAGSGITITATDELGRTGVSNGIEVLADTATSIAVSLGTATAEAGVPFTVIVQLLDDWGNSITYSPEVVSLTDDTGTLSCASSADGNFSCVITASDAADVITASMFSLTDQSIPLLVTNSDLAQADVSVAETTVSAGQAFGASVRGYDAFGNLYTTAVSGSSVTLTDLLSGMAPLNLALDSSGAATGTIALTVAGADAVVASQSGVALGTSSTVTVTPGTMVDLVVSVPPWADVDAGVPVLITAVDAYGNLEDAYVGPVVLTLDGCIDGAATLFEGGEAEVDLACTTPGFQVQVVAEDGTFLATSQPLDVLDFGCVDGPVAALKLDGLDEVVACLTLGEADLAVDTSGTSASTPLVAWHLDDGRQSTRTTTEPSTVVFESAGARRVSVVIADADACAGEASVVAWVGENDGSAVGPITVAPASAAVPNGASTSVSISASDCAGDVASGAAVYVWTDLGGISGATSTGSGLTTTLDGLGQASITVGFTTGYAGSSSVVVSSADGAGFGSATIGVTADSVRPSVVSVSPSGVWSDPVTAITIEFSEPMRASNFTSSSVVLTGPDGVVTATLTPTDDTLTITPSVLLDPTTGEYTVTMDTNVRDTSGNRLSGDWSGAAASWSTLFGAVATTVETGSCSNPTPAFRPDGDSGTGAEVDQVALQLTIASAPTWWSLAVSDVDGAPVRRTRIAGTASTFPWDGRGDDGIIAGEGLYMLTIDAVDATGNTARACTSSTSLSQRGRAP